MRKDVENSEITYVLFGKEAIKLYKLSLKILMNSSDVDFKVGAYSSVKKFVNDTKGWDDYTEIPKEDFLLLRKISSDNDEVKTPKRGFLARFFR